MKKNSTPSSNRRRNNTPRISTRIFDLLVEMRWFFIGAATLFLSVAFSGFDKRDVGWSRAESLTQIQNPAGVLGAWISDLMFYLFGYSAWWLVGLLLMIIWRAIKEPTKETSWVSRIALGCGFLMLILGSAALESMRFYRFGDNLPASSGGLVGSSLGNLFNQLFGYAMSTLALLLILALGWRLFAQMSWLNLFEKMGAFFEQSPLAHTLNLWKKILPLRRKQNEAPLHPKEKADFFIEQESFASPFSPELATANHAPFHTGFKNSSSEQNEKNNASLFHWAKKFPKEPTMEVTIQLPDEEKIALHLDETPPQSLKPLVKAMDFSRSDDSPFSKPFWKDKNFAKSSPFATQFLKKDEPSTSNFLESDKEKVLESSFQSTEKKPESAPKFGISIPNHHKKENPKKPPAFLKASQKEMPFAHFDLPDTQIASPFDAKSLRKEEQRNSLEKTSPFENTVDHTLQNNFENFHNFSSPFESPDNTSSQEFEEESWQLDFSQSEALVPELPIVESETLPSDLIVEESPLRLDADFADFGEDGETLTAEKKIQQFIHSEKNSTLTVENSLSSTKPNFVCPSVNLLDTLVSQTSFINSEDLRITCALIEQRLKEFGVSVKVVNAISGPVVTRFEIEPAVGVKGAQVVNLAKDLARALAVASIRVVETIPGKSYMALELPNPKRQMVQLKDIICSTVFQQSPSKLTVCLGKDIGGVPTIANLAKMPHLLVAGTTGSGKSVGVNAMILSMLYKASPDEVRLIMVDPKMLELSIYEGIPHLLTPVVTDMKEAANALSWCVAEMERRYKLMSALGVRNIEGLNQKITDSQKMGNALINPFGITPESPEALEKLPYIVVIIDELADLMMVVGKKVEELIARLAQKARAAGIHLILATQRPSVDVITGLIKANIPTRIAFQVSSKIDSRTILEQMGAEALLGQGDMLYLAPGTGTPQRVHGAFVSDDEVHRVVDYLKTFGPPQYIDDVLALADEEQPNKANNDAERDPLYDQAVEKVIQAQRVSISKIQRDFGIGYNRASRIVEAMERAGIVSEPDRRGNRDVLLRNH